MDFWASLYKASCIFTESLRSEPPSRRHGGPDLGAGCSGSFTFLFGGHTSPCYTLMTSCSSNHYSACRSQPPWSVSWVSLQTFPCLGKSANWHSAYNGLDGKFTCVQVLLKFQPPRSKNSKIICDLWDGAPALRNEIWKNWLDLHFG